MITPPTTLAISPRRQLVGEIAFSKNGRPHAKVRSGWKDDSGGVAYRTRCILFPQDFDEFLAELEKFTAILDSSQEAIGASVPTEPDLPSSGKRFCFHIPPRPGKRGAVVATTRISTSGRTVQLYVFQNEGQQVLAFLKELRDDLAKVNKASIAPIAAAPAVASEAAVPMPPTPEPPVAPVPRRAPAPPPEIGEYDYSDFEDELLERFDSDIWQELVEEKYELEKQLFLESIDEDDRKGYLGDLESVIGQMNDFCAIKERQTILEDGRDEEDEEEED